MVFSVLEQPLALRCGLRGWEKKAPFLKKFSAKSNDLTWVKFDKEMNQLISADDVKNSGGAKHYLRQ